MTRAEQGIRPWLRQLRFHQWAKNLLLLLPALAAHRPLGWEVLVPLGVAVLVFSLLASGLYAANDIVDLEHDRDHATKRNRPLAAGQLSQTSVVVMAVLLVAAAAAGSVLLPVEFRWAAAVYALLAVAYSLGLKRVLMLDVVLLSGLYTVRVVAGAAAVDVPLSRWFLAFSVFVFTSLALLKRAVEAVEASTEDELRGRGWRPLDLPVLVALGAGCAVAAALVYCLYITSPDVLNLYGRSDALWLGLPLLLYWLGRAWLLAMRGEVHDDPVVFALRDRASYVVLVAFALVVISAS
jgi:4-hydroxybenzoate polyprenyltransferase